MKTLITTKANYSKDGSANSKWLTLPLDYDELEKELEKIAKNCEDGNPEYIIIDYDDCFIKGIEREDIRDLNAFLLESESLDEYEDEFVCDIIEYEGDMHEAIKAFSLHNDFNDLFSKYEHHKNITNDEELGRVMLPDMLDIEEALGSLSDYFDYDKYGYDTRIDQAGIYTSNNNYIGSTW